MRDKANNKNFTETRNITLDTIGPDIFVNFPQNQNYSLTSVAFNVSLVEYGKCNYTLNSGAINHTMSSANNLNFNATNSSIGEGIYTVRFYCWDVLWNINSSEKRFRIDRTLPTGNAIYPPNNTYNTTTSHNFTANFSDDVGLANATLYIFNQTGSLIYQVTKLLYGVTFCKCRECLYFLVRRCF